ncbi:MAG TPA: hypothetical protein DER39_06450, partial [Porphyromonadaceae bacterium]|nr:hypothetical protein [Porphyromonadaceae bacterium]
SYKNGIFELETTVSNYSAGVSYAEVSYELLDAAGKTAASGSQAVSVQGQGENAVKFEAQL